MALDYSKIKNIFLNPLFIMAVGTLLLSMVSFFDVPIGNDEGGWGYIGRAWADGQLLPYSGIADNKTPGIFNLSYRETYRQQPSCRFFNGDIYFSHAPSGCRRLLRADRNIHELICRRRFLFFDFFR